ncbi:MAG: molybdopterin cofactor-binding domain-containing protein, partial [Oricola sp.]
SWGVPLSELTTEPSVIIHAGSGKRMTYGEAAGMAKVPAELPEIAAESLKPRNAWRLIGSSLPRVDIPGKTNGTAMFGIDHNVDGQKYATIVRAPVNGSGPDTIDDKAALAVPGVEAVIPLPYGVAIVAAEFDQCLAARQMLKVTWTASAKAGSYDSDAVTQEFLALAADRSVEGVVFGEEGDAAAALAGAAKVMVGDFATDHMYHATMEPMNAIVHIPGDGTAEIWVPTQVPSIVQFAAAGILKTDPARITVHQTLLGGGYGRRLEVDFVVDAVLVAMAVKAPVKLIWTREEDVQHDKFRPLTAQRIEAGLDADGNIVGWRHRIVADSIFARSQPDNYEKSGGKDEAITEGAETQYGVGDFAFDFVRRDMGVDVGFWRAVGTGYTKFAVEQMVDEIAASLGKDPVDYRLQLLAGDPRGQAVLKKAAEMAGWPRKPEGDRAFGVGFSDDWNTRIAEIVEISLDRETGDIRVHNVWIAVDPGVAVQRDATIAQAEGGAIFGVSAALKEKITIRGGAVQESNFFDYFLLRQSETPRVMVEVLESVDKPGGMGEVAVPPVAPAIANAVAALTGGKRIRQLPMLPERVLAAIRA